MWTTGLLLLFAANGGKIHQNFKWEEELNAVTAGWLPSVNLALHPAPIHPATQVWSTPPADLHNRNMSFTVWADCWFTLGPLHHTVFFHLLSIFWSWSHTLLLVPSSPRLFKSILAAALPSTWRDHLTAEMRLKHEVGLYFYFFISGSSVKHVEAKQSDCKSITEDSISRNAQSNLTE